MKIFENSILELITQPLGKIKIVNDYWGGVARQTTNYEHVFGPIVICAFLHWIELMWLKWFLFTTLVFFHVVAKEVFYDWLCCRKVFNWPNVIERTYGCVLALIVLFI